jgi:hypothetical protein
MARVTFVALSFFVLSIAAPTNAGQALGRSVAEYVVSHALQRVN